MSNFLRKYVCETATVKTDGHKSYPIAVASIKGKHIIVNHSNGFKNQEGFHTNLIKNFWSRLKFEIGKHKGVKRSHLKVFLAEFSWRYDLRLKTPEEIRFAFSEIVCYLFSKG